MADGASSDFQQDLELRIAHLFLDLAIFRGIVNRVEILLHEASERSGDISMEAAASGLPSGERPDEFSLPVGEDGRDAFQRYDAIVMVPSFMRAGMLVSLLALMERSLQELCDYLQSALAHPLGRKDLQGKGVWQAKNYLVKVIGATLEDDVRLWHDIRRLNDLRNGHAHGGDLSGPKQAELRRWMAASPHFLRTSIKATFLPWAVERVEQAMEEIASGLKELEFSRFHMRVIRPSN